MQVQAQDWTTLSGEVVLMTFESQGSTRVDEGASGEAGEPVEVHASHFARSELLRAVLDACTDAVPEMRVNLSREEWLTWKEHVLRPRFEALGDAASIALMQVRTPCEARARTCMVQCCI